MENLVSECPAIISSAREQNLVTRVVSMLPVAPVESETLISTVFRDIPTKVRLIPHFSQPTNTILSTAPEQQAYSITPSQWQHSHCEVLVEFNSLMDPAISSRPLHRAPIESPARDAWPVCFAELYELLDLITWKLRVVEDAPGRWMLLPSDIASIEHELVAGGRRIDWVKKDPPGQVLRVRSGKVEARTIEFDIADPVPWAIRCRLLAERFLSTGETNEALFWLNVGCEAMFEEWCSSVCIEHGIDPAEVRSGKAYWERAHEVILQQYPEIAEKIVWPEAAQGSPSWFTKIRYVIRRASLGLNAGDISSDYHEVNRHRNALFHGTHDGRISTAEVSAALNAFDRLREKLLKR